MYVCGYINSNVCTYAYMLCNICMLYVCMYIIYNVIMYLGEFITCICAVHNPQTSPLSFTTHHSTRATEIPSSPKEIFCQKNGTPGKTEKPGGEGRTHPFQQTGGGGAPGGGSCGA